MGSSRSRSLPILVAAALAAGAASLPGCVSLAEGGDVHASPILERDRPVAGAPRIGDAGIPFLHAEADQGAGAGPGEEGIEGGVRQAGLRPLYRRVESEKGTRAEVLYPLYRQWNGEDGSFYARLFPSYWHDEMTTSRGTDRDTAIVPFLWWGDEPGEGGYFLFLPFGGTVRQRLFLDEGTFVLFPLFLRSRNGEYRGVHLLWPLVHWGSGGGRSSFRFLPFWSASDKEGVYHRRALLWPIVHWSTEEMDSAHPLHGWMVWPLYGRESSGDGYASHTLLWPLFNWADGPRIRARSLPYPFFRTRQTFDAKGVVDSDLFWLWPFYGRYDAAQESSRFYAWPLWLSSETLEKGRRIDGLTVAGVYSRWTDAPDPSASRDPGKPPPEGTRTEWKLWPLAQGRAAADGSREWRSLSLLPFLRWEELDANWAVFVELLHHRRGPDGSTANDALFSLVRTRRGPGGETARVPGLFSTERNREGTSWSFLEGLFGGSTRRGGGSSLRLLWFLTIPLTGDAAAPSGSGGGR